METKQERSKRDLWSMKMEISMELCISGSEEKQKKDMTCCYKNEAKKKTPFQAATTSHPQDTSVQVMSH